MDNILVVLGEFDLTNNNNIDLTEEKGGYFVLPSSITPKRFEFETSD